MFPATFESPLLARFFAGKKGTRSVVTQDEVIVGNRRVSLGAEGEWISARFWFWHSVSWCGSEAAPSLLLSRDGARRFLLAVRSARGLRAAAPLVREAEEQVHRWHRLMALPRYLPFYLVDEWISAAKVRQSKLEPYIEVAQKHLPGQCCLT